MNREYPSWLRELIDILRELLYKGMDIYGNSDYYENLCECLTYNDRVEIEVY